MTPSELLESAISRVGVVEAAGLNAVVITCFERARARARQFEADGGAPGPLYGLPVLVKDNQPVAGEPFTSGAAMHSGRIATTSHPIVERIEQSGGIVFGLTNMPEFALGSHTFNTLYGATSNPHDPDTSAGGSTGGGAAAVACGESWIALGSDLGGSLRQPANFCGIVGLRPSAGRTPTAAPSASAWRGWWGVGLHSVQGPLGRSVADVALALDALTDGNPPAVNWYPDAIADLPPPPSEGYLEYSVRNASLHAPTTIAWSVSMAGILTNKLHPEVGLAVKRAASLLATECNAIAQNASPRDLGSAGAVTAALRPTIVQHGVCGGPGAPTDDWLSTNGNEMSNVKPELLFELERSRMEGWQARIAKAEAKRQEIESSFVRFFSNFDVLICPCSLMPPFDKSIRYPSKLTKRRKEGSTTTSVAANDDDDGKGAATMEVHLKHYSDWLLPCTVVSLASCCPALSLPVSTTTSKYGKAGLPIGVQLVGRPGGEAELLAAAALLERALAKNDTARHVKRTSGLGDGETLRPALDGHAFIRCPESRGSAFRAESEEGLIDRHPVEPAAKRGEVEGGDADALVEEWSWDGPRTAQEAAKAHSRAAGEPVTVRESSS